MKKRAIAELVTGRKAVDGAGVHLVRVLGSPTVRTFDPFLMLDAFDSHNPDDYIKGFPTHPHRGIETFTYLMRGRIDHEDSLGNAGSIVDGGCQWMTAGSGILHQEMPLPSRQMLGLQLWINLPRDRKMVDPEYRDIKADMVPAVEEGGARVAIVAGEYKGTAGATRGDHVDVTFLDISLKPGALWSMETRPQETVFAYMVEGECELSGDGGVIPHRNACLFTLGDSLSLVGGAEGARFVLVSGTPLREPVAWGGPIVMNTDEELKQAFFELEDGTFIRHAPHGKAG
ncbi:MULTISPECIES: pirin family protein [Desulfovibrio]|uniref:Pirin family protein n=1 Tax=Desulfovibrio desulfuricans TaxID=876 RepID=A0AA94L2Q1_DESDE|nr:MULTISPECIES: pirin family protein [Desulfovibrio]ATD81280.1 pirin family protein [Desulfovibrio sp. G11]SFW58457.1 hypothetical protein SAMN02910291_01963 [Desulfovibrio desulfuricans]SPD36913.1 RmlC-like cupin domain [Desulfovibrio sp. G11]